MQKREPERTCIACRKKGDKSLFVKVVLSKNGEVGVERNTKLLGRGAYICKTKECALACKKNRSLNRVFKRNMPDSIYEELINEFGDN